LIRGIDSLASNHLDDPRSVVFIVRAAENKVDCKRFTSVDINRLESILLIVPFICSISCSDPVLGFR
jgi:hypothetical protein